MIASPPSSPPSTPAGVKHLHHEAQHYDVGVYFEANGHGTVLFSARASRLIAAAAPTDAAEARAVSVLRAAVALINETVGDALSDLLLVLAVMALRTLTAAAWEATYTDLPNRLVKVRVADRTVIATTDAERRTTAPAGTCLRFWTRPVRARRMVSLRHTQTC